MARDLKDLLRKGNGSQETIPSTLETATPNHHENEPVRIATPSPIDFDGAAVLAQVTGIEVEAVVGGALQRIMFAAGTNPAQVGAMLRSLDPGAKMRDAFPMKGMGGNRETKTARAVVVNLRASDSGTFWDIVAQNGDDIKCGVSRKNSGEFFEQLRGLGKLSERNLAKLETALAGKKEATVILDASEQFGVKYWLSEDGKAFVDSVVAETPAETTANGENGHE